MISAVDRPGPLDLLAGSLAVLAMVRLFMAVSATPGIDFYPVWMVGRAQAILPEPVNPYGDSFRVSLNRQLQEKFRQIGAPADLQSAANAREKMESTATPFLYAALGGLVGADYGRSLARYRLALLLASMGAVAFFCWRARLRMLEVSVVGLALATWFRPLHTDWVTGNVNSLQLGLLALLSWFDLRRGAPLRTAATGLLLALVVCFKPNLGIVAALFAAQVALRSRRDAWWLSAGIGAGGVLAWAAACLYFRSAGIWSAWLGQAGELVLPRVREDANNLSMVRLLYTATNLQVGLALTATLTAGFGFRLWRARGKVVDEAQAWRQGVAVLGAGALISLLGMNLAWDHYYLLTAPVWIILLGQQSDASPLWIRVLWVLATLMVMQTPVTAVWPHGAVPYWIQVTTAWLGAWGLLGFAWRELGVPRLPVPGPRAA